MKFQIKPHESGSTPKTVVLSCHWISHPSLRFRAILLNFFFISIIVLQSVERMTHRFYNEMRRYYYVTPSSYLDLLKQFEAMLENKRKQITHLRDRIANGLKVILIFIWSGFVKFNFWKVFICLFKTILWLETWVSIICAFRTIALISLSSYDHIKINKGHAMIIIWLN